MRFRYLVYSSYTAGLRFAEVARQRGHDIRLICHETCLFVPLYKQRLPGAVVTFTDINAAATLQTVAAFDPDFIVTCVFDRKVPVAHCLRARRLAVNIHPSRLPAIRTGDSSFWNIMLEDDSFEITMHTLTEVFDAGDILCRQRVLLAPRETRLSLIGKVEHVMGKSAVLFQEDLERERLAAVPQAEGRYYAKPKQKCLYLTLVENATYVDRLVRASLGEIAVIVHCQGNPLYIVSCTPHRAAACKPAGFLECADAGLLMHTVSGPLRLDVVSTDGVNHIPAEQFASLIKPQTCLRLTGFVDAASAQIQMQTQKGWSKGSTT